METQNSDHSQLLDMKPHSSHTLDLPRYAHLVDDISMLMKHNEYLQKRIQYLEERLQEVLLKLT